MTEKENLSGPYNRNAFFTVSIYVKSVLRILVKQLYVDFSCTCNPLGSAVAVNILSLQATYNTPAL